MGVGWLIKEYSSGKLDTPALEVHELQSQGGKPDFSGVITGKVSFFSSPRAKLMEMAARIDLRVLLVGSMLPDIIDKPVGQLIFRDSINNGRIFCHTLLFLLIIALVGVYLYRSGGKLWMLTLSFGTFVHLILDEMWLTPRTLLWPLYGWTFPRMDITVSAWMQGMMDALFCNPKTYISETVGLIILVWFLVVLVRRGKVRGFLREGLIYG
ncbi:MAG: metal-dependent hydrolase [Dehalococcoidia bacterium]|nr:metal-dependent hydrolase [Dehalococcoidia bacterium]